MKKAVKICLITGITCILVGGGIATVASAMGGSIWNVTYGRHFGFTSDLPQEIRENLWEEIEEGLDREGFSYDYYADSISPQPEEASSFPAQSIKSLEALVQGGSLVISEEAGIDSIIISSNLDEDLWNCNYADDGKLQIVVKSGKAEQGLNKAVTVKVPENHYFKEIELKSKRGRHGSKDTGSPYIEVRRIHSGKMELEAEAGAVKLTEGTIGELDISCDAGAVEFSGTVSGDIESKCNVGAVKLNLTGSQETYNYEIESNLGAITVGNDHYAGFNEEKKINNRAQRDMELKCNTGAMEVNFINQ